MVELTEQQILENIIEAHLKNINFKRKLGKSETNAYVISESIVIGRYMGEYLHLPNHPNALKYSAELTYLLTK